MKPFWVNWPITVGEGSCTTSSFSSPEMGGSYYRATHCWFGSTVSCLPDRCPIKYPCHDSRAHLISIYRNNTLLQGGIGYETLRVGVQGIDVDDAGQILLLRGR